MLCVYFVIYLKHFASDLCVEIKLFSVRYNGFFFVGKFIFFSSDLVVSRLPPWIHFIRRERILTCFTPPR